MKTLLTFINKLQLELSILIICLLTSIIFLYCAILPNCTNIVACLFMAGIFFIFGIFTIYTGIKFNN
jgi:hypothetical protein